MITVQYISRKALSALCAWLFLFTATAQTEDAEGSKDHPMLSRIPGFYIYDYKSNFNSHVFPEKGTDENVGKTLEGNLTKIEYRFDSESGKKFPSTLQLLRNYSNAVAKLGGTKVAESIVPGDYMWYVGKIAKDGKVIWVHVGNIINDMNGEGDAGMGYTLFIMEIAAMEQEVTATDIMDALKSKGFIALDIQFDTGKSSIKPESQPIIDQVAQALKTDAGMKVSIEGHTDNVGDAAANKKLSEQRAKAVSEALISKGIAAARLSSQGWGQEKPVADNRTEDGKAKNRRVEIIKK